MAAVLAWGLLALFLTALFAYQIWLERKRPLHVRLQPILVTLISFFVLWVLLRYGDALVHWIWHR
jgi:hypothetical protein